MKLKSAIIAFAFSCFAGFGQAQVPDEVILQFNAAVTGNDAAALREASGTLSASVVEHQDDPRAAALAYEAGWAMCQIGDCEAGATIARLAEALPDTGAFPTAAERRLLVAYIDWTADSDRDSRQALDAALRGVAALPPSMLSLTAFSERLGQLAERNDWDEATEIAGLAKTHLAPARAQIPVTWFDIALLEQISAFHSGDDGAVETDLAHLRGELSEMVQGQDRAVIEATRPLYWKIEAWREVANNFQHFRSDRDVATKEELDAILAEYPDFPPYEWEEDEGEDGGPELCEGYFDMRPPMHYPYSQARRGTVGVVYLRIDLQEGDVADAEVLASVPMEGFADQARRIALQWRWKVDRKNSQPDCGLTHSNLILPVVFHMD